MEVGETTFRIEINGKDAEKDLSSYIKEVTYTDNLSGKADELKVTLDNTDFRFLNDWFMSPGMTVKAWIGQMYCGQFCIDETSETAPPHDAEFRAQSAEFNSPLRTKKSFAHYKKSLKEVVQKYADDHKLKLVGTIPDLNFATMLQLRESDIDFLHRMANIYGCICSVKGDKLVFDSLENIWKRTAAKTIKFSDIKSYRFATSLPDTIDAAVSLYNDIDEGEVQGAVVESTDVPFKQERLSDYTFLHHYKYSDEIKGAGISKFKTDYSIPADIVGVVHKKAESKEEAHRIGLAHLMKKRNKKHTSTITMPLNELLVAGNSINIEEGGRRNGFYVIEKSVHKLIKSGGNTSAIDIIHGAANLGASVPDEPEYPSKLNSGAAGTVERFEKNLG